MRGINLYPWRMARHQTLRRRFGFYSGFFLLLLALAYFGIFFLQHTQQNRLSELQQKQTALNQQRSAVDNDIESLRQSIQEVESLQEMDNAKVTQSLNMLTELPLSQGELTQFQLETDGFYLEGRVPDQQEFERLHAFLKQHFQQVKLSQFNPEQNTLHFRFDVQITESNPKGQETP